MAKAGRVFLRGMTSETYGLKEFRRRQLDAPRVRDDTVVVDDGKVAHSGDSAESRTWWRMGPGDDPFLTQSLQVDRKSTRLNSSHVAISYAVFCLKKKIKSEVSY